MERERGAQVSMAAQATPEAAVGEALADRRRALGHSVEDIALKLKFSRRQIEALEQGRFDRLSGPTFVRGMIRAYARVVGMDPDSLIERIAARLAVPDDPLAAVSLRKPMPFFDSSHRVNFTYAALSIAIVGVIGALAWEWFGEHAAGSRLTFVRAAETPLEPVRAPVQAAGPMLASAQPSPAVHEAARPAEVEGSSARDGTRRIALHFERESWVRIRGRDGRILLSQLNPAGTQRVIEGRPPFDLVIGNAQHVRLHYDDRAIDLAPHVKVDVARMTLE